MGDDSQLMQRVQQGDFGCFGQLVERYRSALIRVATGMLGDAAQAEDLVQETFLAVFAARHTFNPSFQFRTWLWTILLNLCRRYRGKQARRSQEVLRSSLEGDVGFKISEPTYAETALATVLKREESARLQAHLDDLPDVQADAIRLRFFAGLTYDEIARVAGVSLGGARLRVRTGLASLSRRLIEEGDRNEL
jgi:RNA polymerase sigma-70 factor (ECF subfamily)